jgi:hypothetical protein
MLKRGRAALIGLTSIIITIALTTALLGAPATVSKSVEHMEDGNFQIHLRIKATTNFIYTVKFLDPEGAIIDSYSPSGWCSVSDEGELIARTNSKPIKPGNYVELIILSTSDSAHYTWTVGNRIEQIGNPETI